MSNNTGFRTLGPHQVHRLPISTSDVNADLVAASSGDRICVVSMVLAASGAGTVIFRSDSDDIGSVDYKAADPALVLGNNPDGWLQTEEGEALKVNNASALTLSGFITYLKL